MSYQEYVEVYNAVFRKIKTLGENEDEVRREIKRARGYDLESSVVDKALNYGDFIWVESDKLKGMGWEENKKLRELGLFSEAGRWLLEDRFIFPVKDMLGNVIALIGWYPDDKKYITTPSAYFSKKCLFFGMEMLGMQNRPKLTFIVEGIFDRLMLVALGFPCLAEMGVTSSAEKESIYGFFKRVYGIPDNDKVGRRVMDEDEWNLPRGSSYIFWEDSSVKDIDDMFKKYEPESIKEVLLEAVKQKERKIEI